MKRQISLMDLQTLASFMRTVVEGTKVGSVWRNYKVDGFAVQEIVYMGDPDRFQTGYSMELCGAAEFKAKRKKIHRKKALLNLYSSAHHFMWYGGLAILMLIAFCLMFYSIYSLESGFLASMAGLVMILLTVAIVHSAIEGSSSDALRSITRSFDAGAGLWSRYWNTSRFALKSKGIHLLGGLDTPPLYTGMEDLEMRLLDEIIGLETVFVLEGLGVELRAPLLYSLDSWLAQYREENDDYRPVREMDRPLLESLVTGGRGNVPSRLDRALNYTFPANGSSWTITASGISMTPLNH